MQYRYIGPGGLKIPVIGLGGRRMSDDFTATKDDEKRAQDLVNRAIELGIDMIDSSDSYAATENESLLGRLLKGRRNEVVLCTKFGSITKDDGTRGVNGRPEYAIKACEASLKRLKTDVIDLYYFHWMDPDVPIEETVGAMARLKEQGKIRCLGLCNAGAKDLNRAAAEHPIDAHQTEYSLWARGIEDDIQPACRANGIGLIAYYPLGMGVLTGTIQDLDQLNEGDKRRRAARLKDGNLETNLEPLAQLRGMAEEKGCTLSQLALAWIVNRGYDHAAIPGTSNPAHLEENARAADVSFSVDELNRFDEIYPPAANSAAGA